MLQLSIPLTRYHQYQGPTNDCAPFTVAIAVNALTGAHLNGADVVRAMDRPRLRGVLPVVRRIPRWATFPWGIVDELERNHVRARWRFGADEADLLRALAEDRLALPIFGAWRPLWAHVRILVAQDEVRGWGFVDAGQPGPDVLWEASARFARLWRNYGNLLAETL